jgi:segregation and condensation protein A
MEDENKSESVDAPLQPETHEAESHVDANIEHTYDTSTYTPSENGSPLAVKLQSFEGPLDLLLHLIKENKIDIFNIPIFEITDQYLEHIRHMKELDLNVSGEFLVMAATLLFIKSKMLLPPDTVEEEEDEGLDPRDELVQKLLEYQSFKEAARELGFLAKERSKVYTRQISDIKEYIGADQLDESEFTSDLYDLIQAFAKLLKEPKEEVFHEVIEEEISIEEKMLEIKDVIEHSGTVSFNNLFKGKKTRNLLIATFFAILELTKRKYVRIKQDGTFGEILIHKVS